MLDLDLSLIPGVLLLRSDAIVLRLRDSSMYQGRIGGVGSLYPSLRTEINAFDPSRYRRDDAERALKLNQAYGDGTPLHLDYSFHYLAAWFKAFFTMDESVIQARQESQASYGSLIKMVHPYTVIGYRLAQEMEEGNITLQDLALLAEGTLPLAMRPANLRKAYAENHIHNYGEHPIFRWHPPQNQDLEPKGRFNRFGLRESILRVCVNTDDPSIFPTTLPNEFRLLKDAAMRHFGCPEVIADNWAEYLRNAGIEMFQDNHPLVLTS